MTSGPEVRPDVVEGQRSLLRRVEPVDFPFELDGHGLLEGQVLVQLGLLGTGDREEVVAELADDDRF